MRRILVLVICIFLFVLPVNAANSATSVRTTAKVNANGACEVTIEADIRLDDPARGLKFPLGKDIQSVTLNGTSAPLTQSEGNRKPDLSTIRNSPDDSKHLGQKTISFMHVRHKKYHSVCQPQ